jgi:pimeloyl-ACP methyl ester carboxylesterase
MGGINSYLYAARYPQKVERLVIVDFGPDSMSSELVEGWTAYLQTAAEVTYEDPEEALTEWQSADPRAREAELRHFIVHNLKPDTDGRWRWRFDAARLATYLKRRPDEAAQWAALRRVACPTRVLRGEQSEVLSARTAARMAQAMRECSVVEIADGARDLTVQQPGVLAEAVDGFLC